MLSQCVAEPGGFGKYHRFLSFKARGEKQIRMFVIMFAFNMAIQQRSANFMGSNPLDYPIIFQCIPLVFPLGLVIYSPLLLSRSPWLVPYNFGFLQGSGFLTR